MMSESWQKSSYSNGHGGDCVETRRDRVRILVRDTQNRELGQLGFTAEEWTTLLHTLSVK
ncbi:hypothetical protein SUDANB121_02152 [Nocardiopsis dassonvillei]|uniref:DUF397 domain-containing protein n=1 Tax=Nocardiopsis dassonvillei TaxID=2014 RepID=UPI003F550D13